VVTDRGRPHDRRSDQPASPLTEREAQVLASARADRPIREVAQELYLSPGTVRNYLVTVTHKLRAGTRAEAYRRAQERGWI
jgi:two-component system response regulator DesR